MSKTAAELKLQELERFHHAADLANVALRRAESEGDPDKVAAARAAWEAAVKARDTSGISQRHIDLAAQAVLDERGEKHSETNILAPGTTPEQKA